MNKPKYTKDEEELIRKYGAKAELELDTVRIVTSPITGKRITTLDAAIGRKKAVEEMEELIKAKGK